MTDKSARDEADHVNELLRLIELSERHMFGCEGSMPWDWSVWLILATFGAMVLAMALFG